MKEINRAMVLAAGLGKRMRPLTDDRPKPLVHLAGRSLLDRALDNLAAGGITRFVVNSHYKGEMIAAHLANRTDIILSPEEILLETGGGVKAALAGSVWILGLTSLISFPVSVAAAIYLEEYAPRSWMTAANPKAARQVASASSSYLQKAST